MQHSPTDFIQASGWRPARSMPEIPHEYTVRDLERPERSTCASSLGFEEFVRHIRAQGERRAWRNGSEHAYLVVDDWEYWTMGAPAEDTTIINRQRLDAPGRDQPASTQFPG